MNRSSSYLVLQTQYSLSSSFSAPESSSSSCLSAFGVSPPTEPPGRTEVDRDRELGVFFFAGGPALDLEVVEASAFFPFGAGFARGFVTAGVALGFAFASFFFLAVAVGATLPARSFFVPPSSLSLPRLEALTLMEAGGGIEPRSGVGREEEARGTDNKVAETGVAKAKGEAGRLSPAGREVDLGGCKVPTNDMAVDAVRRDELDCTGRRSSTRLRSSSSTSIPTS